MTAEAMPIKVDGRKTKPRMSAEERRAAQRAMAQRRRDRLREQGLTSSGTPAKTRLRNYGWPQILEHAATIVRSYETGVTLRQLFYRLVSDQTLRNTTSDYQNLSKYSAEARRQMRFPRLLDRTSEIQVAPHWDSPRELVEAAREQYRRDRTEGQAEMLWLIVEKAGLLAQLDAWFGDLGVPMAGLSGFASQTDADTIRAKVRQDGRPAVLLYAGDHDPSGEDIYRDLVERTGCWSKTIQVALTAEQVDEYGLPENPGKAGDTRNARFIARHGRLVQVEVDALDPDDLHDLFQDRVDEFWDRSAYDVVIEREEREREQIVFLGDAP